MTTRARSTVARTPRPKSAKKAPTRPTKSGAKTPQPRQATSHASTATPKARAEATGLRALLAAVRRGAARAKPLREVLELIHPRMEPSLQSFLRACAEHETELLTHGDLRQSEPPYRSGRHVVIGSDPAGNELAVRSDASVSTVFLLDHEEVGATAWAESFLALVASRGRRTVTGRARQA